MGWVAATIDKADLLADVAAGSFVSQYQPMIDFARVSMRDSERAHKWHQGCAAESWHIFPRTWAEFKQYAVRGQLWGAQDGPDAFVGQIYSTYEKRTWEVGGLIVHADYRKMGVGGVLACLALGDLLYTEDPLAQSQRVVAHVHVANRDVDRLIRQLRLERIGKKTVPAWQLPAMPTDNDGMVHGDKFGLVRPDTLLALAAWCEAWNGSLKDGTKAMITLTEGATLEMWAAAFREMAA